MEYESEVVEITMSDIGSCDEEDIFSEVEDNKFEFHTENLYSINTKTEPPYEQDSSDIMTIIKTENIKQETNNNNEDTTLLNQKQLDILIKNEELIIKTEENNNNNEDKLSNQLNILIKEEIDNKELCDINYYFKQSAKNTNEEINANENHSKSNLKNTKTQKETNKSNKLSCKHCNYKTSNNNSLKQHSMIHKHPCEQIWYYCTECSYKTLQKGHLKRHHAIHQPDSEVTSFTCAICNYKFKQKCTLRRHIKDVHVIYSKDPSNPNPFDHELFECAKCPYKTYRRSLLVSHMDKHKEVQYICDICSFSTKYRRNLRVHLEIHGVMKHLPIYKCNICKFQTRMSYCLKRHFLSKRHLTMVGKIDEYCPRSMKMKEDQ